MNLKISKDEQAFFSSPAPSSRLSPPPSRSHFSVLIPRLEASRAPVLELHTAQPSAASPLGLGSSPPPRHGPPLPPRPPAAAPGIRDRGSGIGNRERGSAMPKHEFFVDMTCEGCSNAVTRVLHRLGGVNFDIDLPNKKVYIDSEHNVDTLLETLKKTGKNASYLGEKSAQ
ncbi:copper transport protein ATOX1 isoform X2 [Taeniopygia guttata]|uniref:copper transport protein ATOX1 isoform X2 n=1 Tax=Taeniopygia guttata TaxID=59729 RepID=UPI003BB84B67